MIPDKFSPPAHDDGPPQGSLEDLFRHHLAEAKVVPRPLVWEQLDNALLVRQNEAYRRRLVATRWVAAASLLLATLAGADWWARHSAPTAPAVALGRPASTARTDGARRTNGADARSPAQPGAVGQAGNGPHPASMGRPAAPAAGNQNTAPLLAAAETEASAGPGGFGAPTAAPASALLAAAAQADAPGALPPGATNFHGGPWRGAGALASNLAAWRSSARTYAYSKGAYAYNDNYNDNIITNSTAPVAASAGALGAPSEAWGRLALRPTALAGSPPARPLPASLAAVAAVPSAAAAPLRRWQFGASYAAGAFHPNADFAQESGPVLTAAPHYYYSNYPGAYPPSGPSSLALANRSAAEYRENLRGGLDQRLSLRATRLLGGRWALSTGLELGQHEAQSATSSGFVGEQLAVYLPPAPALRTTSFRYRTAGVPVELRRANPVKRGWSPYGRVGAVVSALLSVRSEVEGAPEATKTYSLAAAGSPYRRLLTTLRGGAGVQYRSEAGRWTLSAGPTAELGVLSLNARPAQDFVHQHRPYSVGLEASVDFGGTVRMP